MAANCLQLVNTQYSYTIIETGFYENEKQEYQERISVLTHQLEDKNNSEQFEQARVALNEFIGANTKIIARFLLLS